MPSDIPRPECPRPQFAQDDWLCPYAFAEVLEPNAELVMLHLRIK